MYNIDKDHHNLRDIFSRLGHFSYHVLATYICIYTL